MNNLLLIQSTHHRIDSSACYFKCFPIIAISVLDQISWKWLFSLAPFANAQEKKNTDDNHRMTLTMTLHSCNHNLLVGIVIDNVEFRRTHKLFRLPQTDFISSRRNNVLILPQQLYFSTLTTWCIHIKS